MEYHALALSKITRAVRVIAPNSASAKVLSLMYGDLRYNKTRLVYKLVGDFPRVSSGRSIRASELFITSHVVTSRVIRTEVFSYYLK